MKAAELLWRQSLGRIGVREAGALVGLPSPFRDENSLVMPPGLVCRKPMPMNPHSQDLKHTTRRGSEKEEWVEVSDRVLERRQQQLHSVLVVVGSCSFAQEEEEKSQEVPVPVRGERLGG